MADKDWVSGWVVQYRSGFYTIETRRGRYTCRLRGRLKRGAGPDLITIGDQVKISAFEDGTGAIEAILPRRNTLVRLSPSPRGDEVQALLANPDQIALVFACKHPDPHLRMLDRFLVICEKQGLPALIVANKIDLLPLEQAHALFSPYPPLGYPVIYTSAHTGLGIPELHTHLKNKITGLIGPSGVGKTSLLNTLQPGLGLEVRSISEGGQRGLHTTVMRAMFPLDAGGYVADLPGLRSVGLWDIQPEELDGYFPELRPLVAHCQYSDCTHREEPGCAVQQAVQNGQVSPARYDSYLRLRAGEEEQNERTN
ncbi:MAG: ribosome small subunit-dependent GTPase A [Anaerolineaceae bacterium]|nr:ribosome small subunit-dependent GTPase A [Anaerolineaceae bacterium]